MPTSSITCTVHVIACVLLSEGDERLLTGALQFIWFTPDREAMQAFSRQEAEKWINATAVREFGLYPSDFCYTLLVQENPKEARNDH